MTTPSTRCARRKPRSPTRMRELQRRRSDRARRTARHRRCPGGDRQGAARPCAHRSPRSVDGIVAKSDRLLVGQAVDHRRRPCCRSSVTRAPGSKPISRKSDLARMVAGQRPTVRFDAYPGLKFEGRVASIGAGTGSEFSVLPAQNANGNWVKVTQRVPVRIAFDGTPPRQMIAGLSAHVDGRPRRRANKPWPMSVEQQLASAAQRRRASSPSR